MSHTGILFLNGLGTQQKQRWMKQAVVALRDTHTGSLHTIGVNIIEYESGSKLDTFLETPLDMEKLTSLAHSTGSKE